MKKVKTFFLVVTVIALLAIGAGFLFKYFNPKTKEVARFCLCYGEQTITDTAEITFPRETVTVQAKHVFGFAESDTSFTVQVVPNPNADFGFSVGGGNYRFADVEDLTPAFDVAVTKEGLTINLTDVTMPQGVLEKLFLGAVTLPQKLNRDYYFMLTVTSAGGKTVTIKFNTEPIRVTDTELIPDTEGVFYF